MIGSYYKGQWERGIQSGEGELYIPGAGVRKGQFVDNNFVGGGPGEEEAENSNLKHQSSQIESDKEESQVE